jgi:hypothetical protein
VIRAQLDAVVAALETLGPIRSLDAESRSPGGTVDRSRAVRAEIQEVLDRPRCAYDEAALELYRTLARFDPAEARRQAAGHRRALVPYAVRAPWLALEEGSIERLASGLALLALSLPDEDDYRDVMIGLAPARVCAAELGADAAALFEEAARFAGPGVAETFCVFGRRETGLGAFGWHEVETPHGRRFHLSF